ncbi:pentatricopeptide repeat-containing protein At1g71210, mitochondrial isoform X2 [Rhodamnia argentea]|uniref:Pentatricopeptide repeat-containing protein At1g71210, mitochondrial isoform X2 n=1 Tax=Rhodamnia argentea TaxID=178133 RepID=A0A8B8NJS4_9MYRT|nr:pentatricopeptide repeat-containing protein At1g71210, mitochondrial isoform X2 [Rhodamnia argentea]
MLTLKHVTKTRTLLLPQSLALDHALLATAAAAPPPPPPSADPLLRAPQRAGIPGAALSTRELVLSFAEWFQSSKNSLFDRIFEILGSSPDDGGGPPDSALSRLGLHLTERLVLDVLDYGSRRHGGVLPCLKFFDWAGHQRGFYHTRATFHAIFKILSTAKLMSLMIDFLEGCRTQNYFHGIRFNDTLVMGYAVAGKPEFALQLFGKMRFRGLDLDTFAYHVFLNALVEENCFDAVEMVAKQISLRGFENEITHSIMMKCFCKRKQMDEAEDYLRRLASEGKNLSEHLLCTFVDALCRNEKFEQACDLVEEFAKLCVVPMDRVYGVWLGDLVRAGKLDRALEFFQSKKYLEGYIPDMYRYNMLICKLLRQNRLEEVFDMLMEMKEAHILPDKVTLNATLSFFCKAGMVEVALQLFNLRAEFGLSINGMAYNYLINTLCGDGSTDEAYRVLKNSMVQGHFPGKKTFDVLADALCCGGKLDKMKELVVAGLDRNLMPSFSTFERFILALCNARRSGRGDIAARLLIEMQDNGHAVGRPLFRAVIRCFLSMENPENQFLRFLEMQLSRCEPSIELYKNFIDGAGYAMRPKLAREVYDMMRRNGIQPDVKADFLMLQSYLKSKKVSDALKFFREICQRREVRTKLYNTLITGLCKIGKADVADIAWEYMNQMKEKGLVPSAECYEHLVHVRCSLGQYDLVFDAIADLKKVGHHITTFMGNALLLHSLKSPRLFMAWARSRKEYEQISEISELGKLLGAFTGGIITGEDVEDAEELIRCCFRPNHYTYDLLLRKLCMTDVNGAIELINRICKKGIEPDERTYEILAQSLTVHGRATEAKRWLKEISRTYQSSGVFRYLSGRWSSPAASSL